MKLGNDTLRAGLTDPRFWLVKHGWDGTPREWTDPSIIAAPCWGINFGPDGWDDGNEIAVVTNFCNEGPVATVKCGDFKVPVTTPANTLEALCDEVIRVFLILLSSDPDDDDTPHSAPVPYEFTWEMEEEEVAVELPIDETLWDDLTPKQKKIFIKDWVADFMANTDCSKAVAKMQFEQWLNQEAQYARDEDILFRRSKKDWISEEEEAEIAGVAAAESPEYPVQWEEG